MSTLVNAERERQRLISDLMKWWVANGWNPKTLEKKSTNELVAIRTRAQRTNWQVKAYRTQRNGQMRMNF
jgi:hypothetical protein